MTGILTFNNIKLYGYHGSHAEESIIGNYFIININAILKIDFDNNNPSLTNSVNYETLFEVVKNVFEKRENLIEQVALNIYKELKLQFNQVGKWKISISKTNPIGAGGFFPEFTIED